MRVETTADPRLFADFLLGLSKDTLYNFNHFGEDIDKENVWKIVNDDLQRDDKLRFFAFENEMVGYGSPAFQKTDKKARRRLGDSDR